MFSGLVAFGLAHIESGPIHAWQALFILVQSLPPIPARLRLTDLVQVGSLTLIWSICIFLFLPDSIMKAKCWSEEDKVLLVERLRENELGVQNRQFKMEQAKEAALDPVVWIMFTMQFSM